MDVLPSFPPSPKAACGDDNILEDLKAADTKVTESLNSLSQQIKERAKVRHNNETADTIPTATEKEAAGKFEMVQPYYSM